LVGVVAGCSTPLSVAGVSNFVKSAPLVGVSFASRSQVSSVVSITNRSNAGELSAIFKNVNLFAFDRASLYVNA